VNPEIPGLLVLLTGLVGVRLVVTGTYLSYIRPGMRLPLLAAGVTLLALGSITVVRAILVAAAGREGADDVHSGGHGPTDDGHGHGLGGPPVSWLLLLPLLVLALVAPAPLGAYASRRDASAPPPPAQAVFPPLPLAVDGAVNLTMRAFAQRSLYDQSDTLDGVLVRLTGFVVADPSVPDGYLLTRFAITCCAADARAFAVPTHGVSLPIPANDTWVSVTGHWIKPPPDGPGVVRTAGIQAVGANPVKTPDDPYE
jgi:uncharacterized repeat protein (TIGR03943 family)